jgi:uncharacterized protein (DUF427 family)
MSKSPGHQQWPEHKVMEKHLDQRVRVSLHGETVAESNDVIKVEEDGHPDRYYFPREAVTGARLAPSTMTSECPFKGEAHYFDLDLGDEHIKNAVWTYEDPYDEHRALKERVAFYEDKVPELQIRLDGQG